jgi:hypothetical protein
MGFRSATASTSKVLCRRHNEKLSPLDSYAEAVIRAIIDDTTALLDDGPARSIGSALTLCSGPMFERWLLKLLWGGFASGSFSDEDGRALAELAEGVSIEQLARVLWRGEEWPPGCGFYRLDGYRSDPTHPVGTLRLEAFFNDARLEGMALSMGAVQTFLALRPPEDRRFYRPSLYRLRRRNRAGERLLNFCWPEPGHEGLHGWYEGRPTQP